jgi:hypothetical protein
MVVRRRELLAYFIGAGTAGTILVAPYVLRLVAIPIYMPGREVPMVPIVLLPVFWGLWNALWARRHPRMSIGAWGATFGFVAACGMNAYLWGAGMWFRAAALVVVFLPAVYWLVWGLVVGPLNEALGVEGRRAPDEATPLSSR